MTGEHTHHNHQMSSTVETTPHPDPTRLTTEQLNREIHNLRQIIELQIVAADERLGAEVRWTAERFVANVTAHEALVALIAEKVAFAALDRESIREVVAEKFNSVAAGFLASEKAVEKANAATEKRFDAVNEQLSQQNQTAVTLIPRAEVEARLAALDGRLTDMKSVIDKGFTGVDVADSSTRNFRFDTRANIAIFIAAASGVVTLVSMVLTNTIHSTGH